MARALELTGSKFYRLTVLSRAENRGIGRGSKARWNCLCDCGNSRTVEASNLITGHTKSCGCHKSEVNSEAATKRNTVHGHNKAGKPSPTFNSWNSMKLRCIYPNHVSYKDYGGRGITICDRWAFSFVNFLADMGERPEGMTLDRKDVDGNYDPENCKWATKKEQEANKRFRRK